VRIHHLNCGTMCPLARRLVNGDGSLFARGKMVCHVLLVEGAQGLTLIDSGYGLADVRAPAQRLGRPFLAMTGARLREEETAVRQVEKLGFSARDVRHIVVTHLDLDHAGGFSDFPEAEVHVFRPEHDAAMHPAPGFERQRYKAIQFAHGPRWNLHDVAGDELLGFQAVRAIGDDVYLVPLLGHTRGHSVVAVRDGDRWLLHCGDAYFFHGEMAEKPRCPPGLAVFQKLVAWNDKLRRANQARLRELVRSNPREVVAFSAHDPVELEALQQAATIRSAGPRIQSAAGP